VPGFNAQRAGACDISEATYPIPESEKGDFRGPPTKSPGKGVNRAGRRSCRRDCSAGIIRGLSWPQVDALGRCDRCTNGMSYQRFEGKARKLLKWVRPLSKSSILAPIGNPRKTKPRPSNRFQGRSSWFCRQHHIRASISQCARDVPPSVALDDYSRQARACQSGALMQTVARRSFSPNAANLASSPPGWNWSRTKPCLMRSPGLVEWACGA